MASTAKEYRAEAARQLRLAKSTDDSETKKQLEKVAEESTEKAAEVENDLA
jgi:hypothetical protein